MTHDPAYFHSKDLVNRNISDKILKNRAYEIARDHNYDGYQRALTGIFYKFFDKKTGLGMSINEQLAEKLDKTVIKIFERRKV